MDDFFAFDKIQQKLSSFLEQKEALEMEEHFKILKEYESGSQGKVLLLETKGKSSPIRLICKLSHDLDYNIRHEGIVMGHIRGIRKWCPHFLEGIGVVKAMANPNDEVNVFSGKNRIPIDTLLAEHVPGSHTLTSWVRKLYTQCVYSAIKQLLVGIEMARKEYGLIHYDLHTDNVLLRKCPENTLMLYNLGKGRKICIPTFGVIPVIIDYGFAYTKSMKNSYLYSSMSQTDSGYLACTSDPFYDYRIFLVNVADILEEKDSERFSYFRKKIDGIYAHLKFDKGRGWDNQKGTISAADIVIFTIEDAEKEEPISRFFSKNAEYCCRLIQSLVQIPLINKGNGNLLTPYRKFVREFVKLENSVRSDYTRQILLFTLIETVRECHQKGDDFMRREYFNRISEYLKFYEPPSNVDFDILFSSLWKMRDCIGTIYFRVLDEIIQEKKEIYNKQLSNVEIFDVIDTHFAHDYSLAEDTPVHIWDSVSKTHQLVKSFTPEQVEEFNEAPNRKRADLLWSYVMN